MVRSKGVKRRKSKGFAATTMLIGVIVLLIGVSMASSFFSGGRQSAGLFGWQDTPILSGIEAFFTNIYNIFVVVGSWVTILVLFMVFIGVQGAFLYFYYRVGVFLYQFKPFLERIMKEISGI